jgi:hypothetical protein
VAEGAGSAADYQIERTPHGAEIRVDGVVRATFVGDLDDPAQAAAFQEMLGELFPAGRGTAPGGPTRG